jgi:hypothetical protein
MKIKLVLIGLMAFVSACFLVAAKKSPNVVLILSDDQAWTDYGFMGHDAIATPHLDKLAKESVLFRRGYVPTALCRPSLATLIAGHFGPSSRRNGQRSFSQVCRPKFQTLH